MAAHDGTETRVNGPVESQPIEFQVTLEQVKSDLLAEYPTYLQAASWPEVEMTAGMLCQYHHGKILIGSDKLKQKNLSLYALLKHEHLHWLVQSQMGVSLISAFDEGLAVALADWPQRQSLLQFNQHQLCKVLAQRRQLLPMEPLLSNLNYHGFRHDFRVDLQYASFTDFQITRLGFTPWLALASKREYVEIGRNEFAFNTIKQHFNDWYHFLLNAVETSAASIDFWQKLTIPDRISIKQRHCRLCAYPLTMAQSTCTQCHEVVNPDDYQVTLANQSWYHNMPSC